MNEISILEYRMSHRNIYVYLEQLREKASQSPRRGLSQAEKRAVAVPSCLQKLLKRMQARR